MENLNSAIKKTKNDRNGIIIHSNHGSQYTSNIYKNFCSAWHCYINGKSIFLYRDAVIESFHISLKKGTIHSNHYLNIKKYVLDVVDWNDWYNKIKLQDFNILQ